LPIFFFDTSALYYRYDTHSHSRRVRRIVSDTRYDCYIADVSIVEIASSFGKQCRERGWGTKKFDQMDRRFFDDMAVRRLNICPITKGLMLRARHLIRFAGVEKKRSIKTNDALIACCSLDLALEKKQRVNFYTCDKTLYSVLKDIDAFRKGLDLRLINT